MLIGMTISLEMRTRNTFIATSEHFRKKGFKSTRASQVGVLKKKDCSSYAQGASHERDAHLYAIVGYY